MLIMLTHYIFNPSHHQTAIGWLTIMLPTILTGFNTVKSINDQKTFSVGFIILNYLTVPNETLLFKAGLHCDHTKSLISAVSVSSMQLAWCLLYFNVVKCQPEAANHIVILLTINATQVRFISVGTVCWCRLFFNLSEVFIMTRTGPTEQETNTTLLGITDKNVLLVMKDIWIRVICKKNYAHILVVQHSCLTWSCTLMSEPLSILTWCENVILLGSSMMSIVLSLPHLYCSATRAALSV